MGKELLKNELIELNVNGIETKDDAIKYLATMLFDNDYVNDLEVFIKDVYKREEEGITGIGSNVAIPHGKSEGIKEPIIAVIRTNNFIEWESYDDQPVKLIFLFAVPNNPDGNKEHLRLLSSVSIKLANEQTLGKLLSASSIDEFNDVINS